MKSVLHVGDGFPDDRNDIESRIKIDVAIEKVKVRSLYHTPLLFAVYRHLGLSVFVCEAQLYFGENDLSAGA